MVTGAGSTWNNSPGGGLNIGSFGTGTLTIANGGTVINNTAFAANIGEGAGSQGTVTVTGAGSTWSNSSGMNIGNLGTGTLTIADGGVVTAGPIVIAANTGSIGTLNIGAGAGSLAAAPGTLTAPSVAFGAGAGTLNFNHTSADYVFAPAISGNGTVNVLAGATTLTGANTYTGGTFLAGGTLVAGNNTALGTSILTVLPNAVGPTTLDNTAGATSLANAVVLNPSANLIVGGSNPLTLTGAISGGGALTKDGPSPVSLTAANTYSGGTLLAAGTLIAGNNSALGTGALTVGANATIPTTLDNTAATTTLANAIVLNPSANLIAAGSNPLTLTGAISGEGALTKDGPSPLILTSDNSYSGGTTINAGTLQVGNGGATGSVGTGPVLDDGALVFNRSGTVDGSRRDHRELEV